MSYSFDTYGWFSATAIPGRSTEIAPPPLPYPTGHQANFTGLEWVVVEYSAPETEYKPPQERIVVTAFQIRKALNIMGLRKSVEDSVTASTDVNLQDGWHYAPMFYSDDSMALTMGAALGKTADDMRALFELAAST